MTPEEKNNIVSQRFLQALSAELVELKMAIIRLQVENEELKKALETQEKTA